MILDALEAVVDKFYSSIVFRTLVIVSIGYVLTILWSRRKLYYLSYQLPGPIALPLLGNIFNLGLFGDPRKYLDHVQKMKDRYGEIFRVWLGPELCLIITEAQDVEEILLSKQAAHKGQRYDILATVIGPGILVSSGPVWKHSRRILNSAFNGISTKSYQSITDKHSRHLVENMLTLCDKGYVDVSIHCVRWTGDIIMEALFGHEAEFYKCDKDEIVMKTPEIGILVHDRICKFWLESDVVYSNTEKGKVLVKKLSIYRNYFHRVLSDKIDDALNENESCEAYDELDNTETNSKIVTNPFKVMVEAIRRKELSKQQFLNEFDSLFNAGCDTCYTHLSFFMLMMGMHKRCQDLVWKEMQEVLGDDLYAPVTTEMIQKLPYLDLCLKEITRLFPTGPTQMRQTDEDFMLKKRNLKVPAGTSLLISNFILHRNPKYWDSPNAYEPERFLAENSTKRPHFAYVPFSGGLRNCIAQVFGYDKLKTAAIHLIRSMEFHSDLKMENFQVLADISTRSAKGYYLKINRRERSIIFRTLVLLVLGYALKILWSRRKLYYLSYKLPGPVALPLLGNILNLNIFGDPRVYLDHVMVMKKMYGDLFRAWLGPELCLIMTEAHDVEEVLMSKQAANKGPRYNILATVIGKGLLASSGAQWKNSRHILNPAFNGISIKSYQSVTDKHSRFMAENMLKFCDQGYVDVSIHCLRWTCDIVMEALFGIEAEFYKCGKDEVVRKTPELAILVHDRICKFWLEADFVYFKTDKGILSKEYLAIYRNYYHKTLGDKIDQALKNYDSYENASTEESSIVTTPFEAMLKAIRKNTLSKTQFLNEFDSIFNAGCDTCYTHLSFFILMMGMHKRCQDLVWKEIQEVLGEDLDAPVTSEMIQKLTYLDLCLKEVSRLFPTGPTQMRITDDDFVLKKRNLTIPAGTSLLISNFILHRNPKYWDRPDEYEPERFLPENSAKRPHFAYIPFSAGLRGCIAPVLGYDKLKTAAIHLIRNMEFHSDLKMQGFKVHADISTRSVLGYHVTIKKRSRDV